MSTEEKPVREMPQYQCHKTVGALKVSNVVEVDDEIDRWDLHFAAVGYAPVRVTGTWIKRRVGDKPLAAINGYYILYPDGYTSWSPEEAFLAGYTRI